MPCKKGMIGCKADCLHRQMVTEYRAARHAAELRRESVTAGYPAETAGHPALVTFKAWLKALSREGHDDGKTARAPTEAGASAHRQDGPQSGPGAAHATGAAAARDSDLDDMNGAPPRPTDVARVAVQLADRGWRIFPLASRNLGLIMVSPRASSTLMSWMIAFICATA